MQDTSLKFNTVDEYIASQPRTTQVKLKQLRKIIREVAPGADEVISYNMPGYKLQGMLVYFAAYKNHIGFYPTPSAIEAFKNELGEFNYAKGSVQFPNDQPLPANLVKRIVQYRLKENQAKQR